MELGALLCDDYVMDMLDLPTPEVEARLDGQNIARTFVCMITYPFGSFCAATYFVTSSFSGETTFQA